MITLSIIGVDPYLVKQISKELTPKLSELYEVSPDKIDFYAPECLYIHDGVEQNTWNVLVKVNATLRLKVLEDQAVLLIKEYMKNTCINLAIEFYYYSEDSRYEFIDPSYPRFMTESNSVNLDYEEDGCDDDECDCDHDHEHDEEPYLGNIFADFDKKMNGED